jgi:ribose transport system ATP-binding protein
VTKAELVYMIVGRELQALSERRSQAPARQVALSVRHMGSTLTPVSDVTLEVYAGEILGLTGLVGSGFHEIPYLLYGAWPGTSGEMEIGGRTYDLAKTTPSKAHALGMALLPADRQRDGSIGSLPVADNAMMQVLDDYFTALLLRRRRMTREAARLLGEFDVRPNRPRMLYQSLSGGNQQKVLLAKWLQTDPRLLLLHEPTQGVDVGARVQIFQTLRSVASHGTAVICASSDYEQLEQICDRVLILAAGRVLTELRGEEIEKERITEQSLTAHSRAQERLQAEVAQ